MKSSARPELPTVMDCSTPTSTRPGSTYKSGKVVQTNGATSVFTAREDRDKRYGQFIENDEEHFSKWRFVTLASAFARSIQLPERGLKKVLGDEFERKLSAFVAHNAKRVVRLARPDYKAVSAEARVVIDASREKSIEVMHLAREDFSDMYFVGGERILFYADKMKLVDGEYVAGEPLTSIWDDILSNNLHNEGGIDFPKGKKPEALIKRCLDLVTNPGDLVLDSFAGSGTTGAVAHKMGRHWIMVELGEHCHTHILPRMKKVIEKVAKEKGIAMVIQSNPNAQIVLYAQADSEITEEVVKAFDKEK